MHLLPVIDSDDLPDDIYTAYEEVLPYLAATDYKVQDYIEWPLELKAKVRRSMPDDIYDYYRDVCSFFIDEIDNADNFTIKESSKVLIRPY